MTIVAGICWVILGYLMLCALSILYLWAVHKIDPKEIPDLSNIKVIIDRMAEEDEEMRQNIEVFPSLVAIIVFLALPYFAWAITLDVMLYLKVKRKNPNAKFL